MQMQMIHLGLDSTLLLSRGSDVSPPQPGDTLLKTMQSSKPTMVTNKLDMPHMLRLVSGAQIAELFILTSVGAPRAFRMTRKGLVWEIQVGCV